MIGVLTFATSTAFAYFYSDSVEDNKYGFCGLLGFKNHGISKVSYVVRQLAWAMRVHEYCPVSIQLADLQEEGVFVLHGTGTHQTRDSVITVCTATDTCSSTKLCFIEF